MAKANETDVGTSRGHREVSSLRRRVSKAPS